MEINSPTLVKFDFKSEKDIEKVRDYLTYTNKSLQFEYQKFKKAAWYSNKYGEEQFQEELARKKAEIKQCLLIEKGEEYFTYSGLVPKLEQILNIKAINNIKYPEFKTLPWKELPKFKLYDYQQESVEKLLAIKHGGVEIATGGGKTSILLHIIREIGLKTLVLAPSISIAEQIYDLLSYHLGVKKVGKCYNGKKDFKKLVIIALPQTLIKLDPDSECYKKLEETKVFVSDESHLTAASTLAKICFTLVANASYRFFFSGTQMRNDGLDMLLEGIVGPIVKRMTVREGVDQGYLSKPVFKMFKAFSSSNFQSADPNEMTRKHLYYNDNVNRTAAFLANNFYELQKHPVLILIEEVEQFTKLLPYLKHEPRFAHGPLGENKSKVPEEYWESDPKDLVNDFNNLKIPILVGTSCISTGTDIRPVKTLIYLMGGKSEIQVKQAIGRGTRKSDGKNSCNIIDFDVVNVNVLSNHAESRRLIYNDIYGPIEELELRV